MIHTLSKNNLHDKIEYLDCNYNKYPCNTFHNNKNFQVTFLQYFILSKLQTYHKKHWFP